MENLEKRLMEEIILSGMLITPLIFAPFLRDGFALPKVSVIRLFSVILLFPLAAQLKKIQLNKMNILILMYLILNIVAAFLSVTPSVSLRGRYLYYFGGALQLLCFTVFFFSVQIAGRAFKTSGIRKCVTVSSGIAALYGFAQFVGWDFAEWDIGFGRIFSTFGNPDFLAGFVVLAFPVIFYGFLMASKRKDKLFSGIVLALLFFVLMAAKSRAGWLGFIAGFILLARAIGRESFRRVKFHFFIPIAVVILFIAFGGRKWTFETPGIKSRIICWKAALKPIIKRPVFGYGPDTFAEVITPYLPDDYASLTKKRGNPGYAHNIFIDIIVSTGFSGFTLFLLILIEFFRSSKSAEMKAAVAGFLVFGFFSICEITMWLYFWIFLAAGMKMEDGRVKEAL